MASPIAAILERVGLVEAASPVTGIAAAFGVASLVFYGADLAFFYRHRKRRTIELNSRAAQGAFLALALSSLLLLALIAAGTLERHVGAETVGPDCDTQDVSAA